MILRPLSASFSKTTLPRLCLRPNEPIVASSWLRVPWGDGFEGVATATPKIQNVVRRSWAATQAADLIPDLDRPSFGTLRGY